VLLMPEASAQNSWEVSIFAGVSGLSDKTLVTPGEGGTTRDVGLKFDSGYLLGVQIGENFAPYFGAALEYSLANQPLLFVNLSPSIPLLELDQKVHDFVYNVLFYPIKRQGRYIPFASIGIGASLFWVSSDPVDDALLQGVDLKNRWKFAFSYGGGVKFPMGPEWGLRLDVRDHVTGVSDYGLPSTAPLLGAGLRPNGVLHNWQLSGGLLYTFGDR
jgi:opacity protein-like surface antigen